MIGVESPRIALFCGGRGSATIAEALLGLCPESLTLIVNGYDNGLSTGRIRRLLPGMLGPSDFRKGLVHHLQGGSPADAAALHLLEHRLAEGSTVADLSAIRDLVAYPIASVEWSTHLDRDVAKRVLPELDAIIAHLRRPDVVFALDDCSLGNLVFAGAYLRRGRDFNAAITRTTRAFGSPLTLANVTNGENAYLVALKESGEILHDEADIVEPQSPSPIRRIFLIDSPMSPEELDSLTSLTADAKADRLTARQAQLRLGDEAREAIANADLIVYGPGTPHSSLLPSYLTPGVGEAIFANRGARKVLVTNLSADHDIRGYDATMLASRTLEYLGDPKNTNRSLVTHVLAHRPSEEHGRPHPPLPGRPLGHDGPWRGATWIDADLQHPSRLGVHDGARAADLLIGLLTPAVSESIA
ncbi:2-phospho-L-lactate transferase CofD family protein [Microbacterium sp. NPDC087665]|uniref:2-phospho-L-lactate transferase CofD family protein n=1 Tax=Microbacterium sp. NPDC087665 TaxID=3364194 RepID=UPI00380189FA